MNKNKSRRLLIICSLLLLLCGAGFVLAYQNGGRCLSAKPVTLSNVNDVSGSSDGYVYVVNHSGQEILRINQKNQADLLFKVQKAADAENEVAKAAAADGRGNLYVHCVSSNEDALSWYSGETIYLYDARGQEQEIVYEDLYEHSSVSYRVNRLQSFGNCVYAILFMDDEIQVRNLSTEEKLSYPFPEGTGIIRFALYYKDGNCLYAYTKDGRLLEIGSKSRVLYETEQNGADELVFSDMSMDEEGNLFFCDALSGALYEFKQGFEQAGSSEEYFIAGLDCAYGDIYTDGFSLMMERDGQMEYRETLSFSAFYQICHVICLICLCLGSLALLLLVLYLVIWLFSGASYKVRMAAAFAFVVSLAAVGICTYFTHYISNSFRENIVDDELTAARTINAILDKEAFVSLSSVTDFDSAAYLKVKEAADTVMLDEDKIPGQLYLMMYTYEDGWLYLRYSEDEGNGCNYPYYYSEDDSEQKVYDTGNPLVFDRLTSGSGVFQSIYYPIKDAKGSVIGIMEVGCDLTAVNNNIRNTVEKLLRNIAAVCLVFLLIILEFIEFANGKHSLNYTQLQSDGGLLPVKLYRLLVFLIFFLTNITTPFLSIYALELSKKVSPAIGISAELLAAVPISAEVVSGALFSFLGSGMIRKIGSRRTSIWGAAVFAAGLAIRAIHPSLILLILGNFVQGAGWGIMLLIVNARLAALEDEKLQESGFTDYNIAVQNGINSGVVLGGFLLVYFKYRMILIIVAVLSLSALLYCFLLIYNGKKKDPAAEKSSLSDYLRFTASPRILFYLFLIVLPVISASYYLNYLYPILADHLGMSEDWIGYSFLLNGMVMICFGNMINSFVSRRIKKKSNQMMAASLIYLLMFGLVGYFNNIPALLLSLVLMAVTCSFGYVAQSTFFSELREVEEIGYEKAIGVYSLFENLAQAAGSFLFGYICVLGVRKGLFLFGMIIAGCGILFAVLINRYDRKHH